MTPCGEDQARRRRGKRAGQEGVGGCDGNEAGRREIEDEGVSRVRLGQGDGPVGPAVGPKEARHGKNATVCGKVSVRQGGKDVEGVSPRCAYA